VNLAVYRGLPAVPTNSWGWIPDSPTGLHSLLFGSRVALATVLSPFGTDIFWQGQTPYEVFYGESLVIAGTNMADTTLNFTNHISALVSSSSLGWEIYQKMNCSTETFAFADDGKALDNFVMRRLMVTNMMGMNASPRNPDVAYVGDGYVIGGTNYYYARAGDTYFLAGPTYLEGAEWQHAPLNLGYPGTLEGKFEKKSGVSAAAAVQKLYPFRGECAGAVEICLFQSALDVLGSSRFNAIHSGSFGLGYFGYPNWRVHVTPIWQEDPPLLMGDKHTLVPGDYFYMKNKDDYKDEPHGPLYTAMWQGENCIYYGLESNVVAKFGGLGQGLSDVTEGQLRERLRTAYTNENPPRVVEDPIDQIRWTLIHRPKTGE
jgi:hypothetical protein